MDGPAATHPKVVSFRQSEDSRGPLAEYINEQSPLIQPRRSGEGDALLKVDSPDGLDDWQEEADEETKSSWYLFLLTLSGLGLQIGWSVETSNGSPYLLSLGLSKSFLALVWIAGPLSGVLVQPYVGMKSDNCRMRWGKRRPFIVGGAAATIVSLMILAWTKEIVSGFLGIFGADKESRGVQISVMVFAVLFVYVLDFAINVIQAGIRAFIVDCAPTHQQESANAWIMRTSGAGNILGYLAGNIKLPQYLPFLGDTQFKVLCAIASFIMALTVGISCVAVEERDPRFDGEAQVEEGLLAFFKSLYRSVRKLPLQIKRVCQVQFFAWIGWFPFLFYITTYVGEIYTEPEFEAHPDLTDTQINDLLEEGTRIGSRALLIFAITTFAASVFLPFIIPPTYEAPKADHVTTPMTPMTPTTPHSMSGSGYFSYDPHKSQKKPQKWSDRWARYANILQISSLTLRRAWFLSHIMFAVLMAATFFVRSTFTATVLVGLIGIPWGITNWAPFALISSEISKRDAMKRGLIRPASRDAALIAAGEDDAEGADQAGVVLGIHNVAIAAPQVIATFVSSIIFKLLQKPRGTPGDNSVAWVLRFGGICALVAAYFTLRVREDKEDTDLQSERRRRFS
ncbi:hypothetical protein BU24DRAFT_257875 [Aaosphaeria arxii CBS 175.79]|uniref:MFS general substrate transporter n=1 Tax=Aaosphaeria arxii CBS 175.79 TaxID=1450172 RepID=A0A6A5XIR0_9PLEO|nr:uncharacterized protein BU24DRAFT_257875 [Aaosphaeria arxii CBS 175.79]KAF2012721.1 hypothetical protein BU24DRAFT_257875 [Aaosphaeria arxii CBS 175.79]